MRVKACDVPPASLLDASWSPYDRVTFTLAFTMAAPTSHIVFDDIFTISDIDKEGKKFDRGAHTHNPPLIYSSMCAAVSRLYARSKNYEMELTLDYNVELFPLKKDQSFALALATSLSRGPVAADDDAEEKNVWRPDGKGQRGLEEDYDYVMYGKASRKAFSLSTC